MRSKMVHADLSGVAKISLLKHRLWSYARWVLFVGLLGLAVGVVILIVVSPRYDAIAVIAAPIDRGGAKIRGETGAASSPGLLANITLSGAQATPPLLQRFQQTVHSRKLADVLFKNDILVHTLFSDRWDDKIKQWRLPAGSLASIRASVFMFFHRPTLTIPTPWHLQAILDHDIVIIPIPRSSAFEIKYSCRDPEFCLSMLRAVIDESDALIRRDIVEHDKSYISFLTSQLQTVTDVSDRQIFSGLLSDIRRDEMLAASGVYYSIDVMDYPAVSALPTNPNIGMTLILSLFSGILLSGITALLWEIIYFGAIFGIGPAQVYPPDEISDATSTR